MANLIFPCKSCGVWHDASVPCPVSQQIRSSARDEVGGSPQTPAAETTQGHAEQTLAGLVQQADEMEDEALRRFRLLRDVGPAMEG
jgi:hypothetical protein